MVEHEKAITDMIDFIAEFELWLEGSTIAHVPKGGDNPGEDNEAQIIYDTFWAILTNYREFKKRIQYDE